MFLHLASKVFLYYLAPLDSTSFFKPAPFRKEAPSTQADGVFEIVD